MLPKGLLIILILSMTTCGCIHRTLHVYSNPSGAEITLNHNPSGETPINQSFHYYGTYGILLEKEGYDPFETEEKITGPWYDRFPIDLFFEVLPIKFLIEKSFTYTLEESQHLTP
jgi:hypothetical protein